MTQEQWNEENADDGGPQFEDLFPAIPDEYAGGQIEADRIENESRTRRKPR